MHANVYYEILYHIYTVLQDENCQHKLLLTTHNDVNQTLFIALKHGCQIWNVDYKRRQ